MSSDPMNPPGLVVSTTEPILSFLTSASTDPHLSHELQQIASNLSSKPNVPYKSLRALWVASDASTRPQLAQLFSGCEFVLTSPKPREKVKRKTLYHPFVFCLVCNWTLLFFPVFSRDSKWNVIVLVVFRVRSWRLDLSSWLKFWRGMHMQNLWRILPLRKKPLSLSLLTRINSALVR